MKNPKADFSHFPNGEVTAGSAELDFCIVLGGDGTILGCAKIAALHGIPILGINLGTLGFLTAAKKENGLQLLSDVLKLFTHKAVPAITLESRMMLELLQKDTISHVPPIALNDFCFGPSGGLKTFTIYVNGHEINTIRADGIIVATPTGSTAYSLSAGGPILIPNGQMMAITPICPHSLSARPLVIGEADIVSIKTYHASPIIADGVVIGKTTEGECLTVQKSRYHTSIIRTKQAQIYDVLSVVK